jgi:hypothetical protein
MASEVKRLLNENYFREVDSSFKDNPKRMWSVLSQKSKSYSIAGSYLYACSNHHQFFQWSTWFSSRVHVSHGDQSDQSPTPVEIATFFNTYFPSVFSSENLPDELPTETSGPAVLTELNLTESEVETILNSKLQ